MRKLGRIIKWVLGIALLIPLVVVTLFFVFKKDIEAYGIKAINEELTVPFTVESYDATLWKTFPNFAFTVYELKIEESAPIFKKPLAEAKEVSLVFNIVQVIRGNFTISKVKAVELIARVGSAKKNNYDILKSTQKEDTSNQAFQVEDISLVRSKITYWNKSAKLKIKVNANDLQAALSIRKEIQEYDIDLNGRLVHYVHKKDTTIQDKPVDLKTTFTINDDLTFKSINLGIAKSEIVGKGTFYSVAKNPQMELDFKSKNLTLVQLIPWIPSSAFNPNKYKSTGVINASGAIKGPLNNLNGLIEFSIQKGSLTQLDYDVPLKNINTQGSLSFGKREELTVKQFSANLDDKPIVLHFKLSDFSNPFIDIKAKAHLGLEKVGKLTGIEQILGGSAKVDVSYQGLIHKLSNSKTADQWEGEGFIELIDASVYNKDNSKILSSTNGTFKVKSNILTVSKLDGLLTGSPFQFTGEIFPVATYLFTDKHQLNVKGNMHARHIDYDKLNYIMVDERASTQKNEAFSLPEGITANLSVSLDSFTQGKFRGQKIKGKMLLSNQIMKLNDLGIQFYDGSLSGNLTIRQQTNGNFIPVGSFQCKSVPIKELFIAFDNFSQTEITEENLSGKLSATIHIAGVWSNTLDCDFDKFFAQLDLNISEGRLQNYEPMNALAQFVNVKELMDIRFEPVNQSIEIKNNWIYFSPMQIKNNAVNLEILEAKHSLDNEMDYHLKLRVNDLLAKKYSLRQKRDESQYTSTSDGGMNLYIHMFGNADNLKFRYDRKNTTKVIKESIKEEKKTVKELLRKELGLKPKDSTVLKPKHVDVDWDE